MNETLTEEDVMEFLMIFHKNCMKEKEETEDKRIEEMRKNRDLV